MMNTENVIDANLEVFCTKLVEKAKQGWDIDPANPPALLGWHYECWMQRDEDIVDPPAKRSQAEILADARAAKRAKKEADEAEAAAKEASE